MTLPNPLFFSDILPRALEVAGIHTSGCLSGMCKRAYSDAKKYLEAIKCAREDGTISIGFEHYKRVVIEAVKRNGLVLCDASGELQGDPKIVLAAVKQNGWALQFASAKLQGDKEIVIEAVKKNGWALQFASAKLQGDKEIVIEAVSHDGLVIRYAPVELHADPDVRRAAC
jgi:lambda repressor-like predicted transcriptional regulator